MSRSHEPKSIDKLGPPLGGPEHREIKELTIRTANGGDCLRIAVSDNGAGIQPDNLTRIFSHGFTTKKEGHGFGLHSAALAAKEMGGNCAWRATGRDSARRSPWNCLAYHSHGNPQEQKANRFNEGSSATNHRHLRMKFCGGSQ